MLQHRAPGCLVFFLTGISFFQLSSLNPIGISDRDGSHEDTPTGLVLSVDGKNSHEPRAETENKEEDELFGDVDPQQLAAILVEALKSKDKDITLSEENGKDEELRDIRMVRRADKNRELEMLIATQREKEDRDQNQEEENVTEKVMSRTTSQTVQVHTKQHSVEAAQTVVEGQSAEPHSQKEEQLSPEELQSLETMMKKFPRLSPFQKREDRPKFSYNEINKDPDMSKKKLKWQEETQKALNFPTFRGGNFMDEFEHINSVADNTAWPDPVSEQEASEELKPEIEEKVLSPEEEEAQAKAEQDEMRRQAAEAQRAKMEEEKLADIASDMLLHYMGKESHRKYNWPASDAAEDKRSDEQKLTDEDDIDPQTIDKLIEISSKLHLPADDVVDIISDVEKKKRKDVAPDMSSLNPLLMPSNKLPVSQTNKNSYSQTVPLTNRLKTWFHDKSADSQDLWRKPVKLNPSLLAQQQNAPERWLKPLVWTGQSSHPLPYPAYYQRRPYPAYYPPRLPPPPRPQLQYYTPKIFAFNTPYTFLPQPSFRPSWTPYRTTIPYYTNKPRSPYPWTFQLKAPPNRWLPLRQQFYLPASTPAVKKKAYQTSGKTNISSRQEDLKKYIQQMILKQAHKSD